MPTDPIYSILDVMFSHGVLGLIPFLILLGALIWTGTMEVRALIEYLRPGTTLSKGEPVIAYKVAALTESGFSGISGGGTYGYLSQGRLDPGFHGFKTLADLQESGYSKMGNVVLEVLLYGAVSEFESGYIGSHQRVLQVVPNHLRPHTQGCCAQCGRSGIDLYFDRGTDDHWSSYSQRYGRTATLYCGVCKKLESVRSIFTLKRRADRFVPLSELVEQANSKSTNRYPVSFVSKLKDLSPTILELQTSAR